MTTRFELITKIIARELGVDVKLNLLFLEDDPTFSKKLELFFKKDEFTVVSSGIEGLELISKNTYDFVIVDFFVSDMTGTEFVTLAESLGHIFPYIYVTSSPKLVDISHGCFGIIDKSKFSIQSLSQTIYNRINNFNV